MYFKLFDKLCKEEISHAEIQKVQEDLKERIYYETEKEKCANQNK